jgi:peroxin-2
MLLHFLIVRLTVWEGRPLPGMALMNLRHRNECSARVCPTVTGSNGVGGPGLSRAHRGLYCLGTVVLQYLWSRAAQVAAAHHWRDRNGGWRPLACRLLQASEGAFRLASLGNFLVFLAGGEYRTLLERALKARLMYIQPSASRVVSYEYLNRQLVWSELSEVLLFLLPLVNVAAVKRSLRAVLPRLPALVVHGQRGEEGDGQVVGRWEMTSECGICGTSDILQPYVAVPCGHRFCYFCLRGHVLADPGYQCPTCLAKVRSMRPAWSWSAFPVLERAAPSG